MLTMLVFCILVPVHSISALSAEYAMAVQEMSVWI